MISENDLTITSLQKIESKRDFWDIDESIRVDFVFYPMISKRNAIVHGNMILSDKFFFLLNH